MKTFKTFRKFQPGTANATSQINDLVKRGGVIISDNKDYVEILRLESVAKIDRLGRVEWREFQK